MTDFLPRSTIVPSIIREIPAFDAMLSALDEVLNEQIDEPTLLLADLRNVNQDSGRYVLSQTAKLLGFAKRDYYLNEDRLNLLVSHLPKFRTQNTTEVFRRFFGFLLSYPAGIDSLWTDDYVGFFSVPQGPLLVDGLGNRLVETAPNQGWYNTTHVLIRANPRAIFPDAADPYEALRDFFYALAPGYLVLEFIGNIAPAFETQLQLNVGVVEGHTIEHYQFPYEILRLATSWENGRPLPVNLRHHGQSAFGTNDVLLTGGLSNTRWPTKVAAVIDLNSLYWTHVDPPFKDSTVVDATYDSSKGVVLLANDKGELASSTDGGLTWAKVWSPAYESETELMIVFSPTLSLWVAVSRDGRVWTTTDPNNWTGAASRLPGPVTAIETSEGRLMLTGLGVVYWSDNGVTWSTSTVQTGVQLNALAYGNQKWIAVGGCGKAFYSSNGTGWTEVNCGAGENELLWAVFSVDVGEFVVGGRNAVIARSTDALVWKLCEAKFRFSDVEYGGYVPGYNRYFAVGDRFSMSEDGDNWNLYESPFLSSRNNSQMYPRGYQRLSATKSLLVYGTNTGVSVGRVTDRMYRTTDMNEERAKHAQLTLPSGNVLVVGGENDGVVLDTVERYDPNTRVWTNRTALSVGLRNAAISHIPEVETADIWVPRGSRFGYSTVEAISYIPGSDDFLAVGQNGILSRSQYGILWEQEDSPFPSQQLVSGVYNPNRDSFLIVANSMPDAVGRGRISTDDGLSWQEQALGWPTGGELIQDLVYLPRKRPDVMALSLHKPLTDGTRPNVATIARSRDGRTWEREDVTTEVAIERRNNYYGIHIDAYDRYVIAVDGGVVYSSDGDNWSFGGWGAETIPGRIDAADKKHPWLAVGYGEGVMMALRADGKVLLSYDGGAYWSRGTGVDDSFPTTSLPTLFNATTWANANEYLEYTSALVYLASANRWIAASTEGSVQHSTNSGQTWTQSIVGAATEPKTYRLTSNGTTIVYTYADSGIKHSTSGTSWTTLAIAEGSVAETRAACACYHQELSIWLAGGQYLWSLNDLGGTGIREIPVALARGPTLTGVFVGGDLGEQRAVYQITCLDDVGESEPSPQFVIDIPASNEGVGIALSWAKVPNVRGYRVYGRRAGTMYLLAEVGPETISYVDEGAPVTDHKMPLTDTSGLMFLLPADRYITALTYVSSLGITFVATKEGFLAWSKDLVSWYGVRNPNASEDSEFITPITVEPSTTSTAATVTTSDGTVVIGPPVPPEPAPTVSLTDYGAGGMGFCAFLLAKESSAWYFMCGDGGNIARSRNGTSWSYESPVFSLTGLRRFAYDTTTDTLVIGTDSQDFARSQAFTSLVPYGEVTTTVETGASDRAAAHYRYWFVRERDGDGGWPSMATAAKEVVSANASYISMTRADNEATSVAVYRQTATNALFTTGLGSIYWLGRVPVNGTFFFDDRWDDAPNSVEFDGAGLDDLVVDDTGYLASGELIRVIEVQVASTGATDQVAIQIDGGGYGAAQNMVSGPSALTGLPTGVDVSFTATTGHTLGDKWTFVIRPTAVVQALPTVDASYVDLGDVWTATANSLAGFATNSIAHINDSYKAISRFVAVGDDGRIVASESGDEWYELEMHATTINGAHLRAIGSATIGESTMVVLAGDDKLLAAGNNFFNEPVTVLDGSEFTGAIYDVQWNSYTRLFTAVGEGPSFGISSDGRNWRQVYLNVDDATLRRTVVGDSLLFRHMVVGDGGAFLTSYDGRAWTTRDIGYETGAIKTIISGGTDNVLIAGDGGVTCFSADAGATWTQSTWDNNAGIDVLGGCYCATLGLYILVGKEATIATSPDGTAWTLVNPPIDPTWDITAVANRVGTSVLVAVCSNGELIRSSGDASSWTRLQRPEVISGWTDIAVDNTTFVATSYDGKVAKSADDGSSWTVQTVQVKPWYSRKYTPADPQLIDFTCVTYGDGKFVIGGSQGDVLVSDSADPTSWTLKNSRLIGNNLQCMAFGSQTYLAGGRQGVLITAFTGFTEKTMLTGGSASSGTSRVECYVYDDAGNSWAAAADDLATARQQHGQVTMIDGSVLVIGGYDDTGTPLLTTERYLPHRDIWVPDLDLPYPKGYMRADKTDDGAVVSTGAGCDPFYSALVLIPVVVPPALPLVQRGDGVLPAGDYFYRISVSTVAGETVPCDPQRIQLTSTGGVLLTWEPVPNAVEYNIYGRAAGSAELLVSVPGHLNQWLDIGVGITSDRTFRRTDTTQEIWFELRDEQPVPREGHGFSRIDHRFVMVGGYQDRRVTYLTPYPSNFMGPTNYELDSYFESDYVDDGYVEGN